MKSTIIVITLIFLIGCNYFGNKDKSIPDNPNDIQPLKIGDTIPNFKLEDINGQEFNLYDYLKKKPTIIIVYRGGWCMYCNRHLGQIQLIQQNLFDLGFQILGISADLKDKRLEMIKKHDIDYDLARDIDLKGALNLGLVYDAEKLYSEMLEVLENYSGSDKHLLPVPAVFIADKNAVIHFEYVNPNHKIRIDPELLLVAAKVFIKNSKNNWEVIK